MKLERAKRHIRELEEALKTFFAAEPYKFSGKPDLQDRKVIYSMDTVKPVPSEIPLIAGDVIQNLRSALDHVAYQIYRHDTGGKIESRKIYFPIAADKAKYHSQKASQTTGISSRAIAAIDAIEPYAGGNDSLWYLHTLNNIDKHRLLLTAGSAVRSFDIGTYMMQHIIRLKKLPPESPLAQRDMSTFIMADDPSDPPLSVGSVIFTDNTSTEISNITMKFHIALFETGIAYGKPLLETLQEMIITVEKVIKALSQFT